MESFTSFWSTQLYLPITFLLLTIYHRIDSQYRSQSDCNMYDRMPVDLYYLDIVAYILIDWVSEFHSFVQGMPHVELNQFHQTFKLSIANGKEATFTLYPTVLNLAFRSAIKQSWGELKLIMVDKISWTSKTTLYSYQLKGCTE